MLYCTVLYTVCCCVVVPLTTVYSTVRVLFQVSNFRSTRQKTPMKKNLLVAQLFIMHGLPFFFLFFIFDLILISFFFFSSIVPFSPPKVKICLLAGFEFQLLIHSPLFVWVSNLSYFPRLSGDFHRWRVLSLSVCLLDSKLIVPGAGHSTRITLVCAI